MPGRNLTDVEAAARSDLVTVDRYRVTLDLTTGDDTFATTSAVVFTATAGAATFIDFIGDAVLRITLNGVDLPVAELVDDARITLPDLAEHNELEIEATGRYMNTGEGLHRLVDPVDQEVYLYSQFEVSDARRMFPVFDQPDLKATYAFTVTAPDHWQVLSNSPSPTPTPVRPGVARWEFPATERMSSYITALVAGPYEVRRDIAHGRDGDIPLGLYARSSMATYLNWDNVFEITKAGLAFFEEEFDRAYPFAKYDQIFTPEYNMGAMENAGCVTINEVYVFRGQVPDRIVERRALTILHELAHMWFGNLVTMTWWNDLWLNESFAEWAATTAQAERTEWVDAWATFGTFEKEWAYRQDQQSTTHPVVAPIRDLHDVEINFDGITYAKGASALKQLAAFVGREPFVAGLRTYFAQYAWGNTVLTDLLKHLSATSGRDLAKWSATWLETAGVNTLRPDVVLNDQGQYASVVIEQLPDASAGILRPHRLRVGTYALIDGVLTRTTSSELDVVGARTPVPALIGQPEADLLLINDEDLTYAKIRFDPRSLATVLAHPSALIEAGPRTLVVTALWDMVRDGELPAGRFVELAFGLLNGLSDSTMMAVLLTRLMGSPLAAVPTSILMYTPTSQREELRRTAVTTVHSKFLAAEPGSDAQLQLAMAWLDLLGPGDDVSPAAGLLDGTAPVAGFDVGADMRWRIVCALAAAGSVGEAEIDAELAGDDTANGRAEAAKALASRPTIAAKAQAWEQILHDTTLSNSVVDALAAGFTRAGAEDVLAGFVTAYHEALLPVWRDRPLAIGEAIVSGCYPRTLASAELLSATQAWLDAHPDAPAPLIRLVTENRDEITIALTAQARTQTS
ncbi:MAG: aminopeptidase N [Nostocoides sp.]